MTDIERLWAGQLEPEVKKVFLAIQVAMGNPIPVKMQVRLVDDENHDRRG